MKKIFIILLLYSQVTLSQTRWYFDRLGTPPISPAANAAWTKTPGAGYFYLYPGKLIFSRVTTVASHTSPSSGTVAPQKMLSAIYISIPLSAQTIANGSTFSLQMRFSKNATASTGLAQLYLRLCAEDGTNVREIGNATNATALTTTLTNRTITITLGANLTVLDGDRFILELGESYTAGTTAHTCSVSSVIHPATTDLPVDNTTTTANLPWFESSQTLKVKKQGGFE